MDVYKMRKQLRRAQDPPPVMLIPTWVHDALAAEMDRPSPIERLLEREQANATA